MKTDTVAVRVLFGGIWHVLFRATLLTLLACRKKKQENNHEKLEKTGRE
jgi:hypothetical protein